MVKYCVALDGSPQSVKAFELALTLAKTHDAIVLLSVLTKDRTTNENRTATLKLLDDFHDKARAAGVPSSTVLMEEQDDPRSAIIEMVEKINVDTLVVGTRGLGALKRAMMGSVSSYCLANAPCDVLIAK